MAKSMHPQVKQGTADAAEDDKAADGCLFPPTQWALIDEARAGSGKSSRKALSDLCELYWYPLYAFVRGRGFSAEDAEDITQGFFAQFLAREDFNHAEQRKGRLRAFLLASMKHYIASWVRRSKRQKRGGETTTISFDYAMAEERCGQIPVDSESPEVIYEKRWAVTLLHEVMRQLRDECMANGRGELFDALPGHFSLWSRRKRYAETAATLGVTEGALKVSVHRLRHRYRDLLRHEIGHTVVGDDEVDEEINHLFQLFS